MFALWLPVFWGVWTLTAWDDREVKWTFTLQEDNLCPAELGEVGDS
jgi:hypothetical protein